MAIPLIFGHRGASKEEPENTMKSFQQAFFLGADGIEFDVQKCSSGEIVIIHDITVDRTTKGSGKVGELTLQELRKLDFGKSETISTLEEVLKKFGNQKWLNIEIKEEKIEKQVVDILKDCSINKKIIISSFYTSVITGLKEYLEEIDLAFLYDFPLEDIFELLQEMPVSSIHPGENNVSANLINNAHQHEIKVRSWTIDEINTAVKFTNWQIDGIITNDIRKMKHALQPKSS